MVGRRFIVGSLVVLISATSIAQDVEPEKLPEAKLEGASGTAFVSFDVRTSFTEEFRRRIAGGLEGVAIVDVTLLDPYARMIASRSRVCRFHLDIWDDILEVRISDGGRRRRYGFLLIDDGLRACGVFDRLEVTRTERLAYARGYSLRVIVRLNPVSEDLLRQSRDFMSNPRGTSPDRPRTFFGAIARLFSSEEELDTGETFHFEAKNLARPELER